MIPLRQATIKRQKIGPILYFQTGAPYTTVIPSTDIHLWKEGGTLAPKNNGGSVSLGGGLHEILLDEIDTNTPGRLSLSIGALSLTEVFTYDRDFLVLPQDTYDQIFGGSGHQKKIGLIIL